MRWRIRPYRRGAMLLEVVLALGLFFISAGVIVGALNSAVRAQRMVRLEAQAADLGITLMSQMQTGQVPAVNDGPVNYDSEDLQDWTRQILVEKLEVRKNTLPAMQRITVVIRRPKDNILYRLSQLAPVGGEEPDSTGGAAPAANPNKAGGPS